MRHRKVFTAAAAAALLMSALPAVAAEAPDGRDPGRPDIAEEARDKPVGQVSASDGTENAEAGDRLDREALATTLAAEDDEGTYIVQFHSPAAPAYTGGLDGLTATASVDGFDPSSAAVEAYQDHLAAEQNEGLEAIEAELGRKVSVVDTYDLAINGASMRLEPAEAAELALLPEVAYVERERVYELMTDAGPEHLGAETVWDGQFTGADPETEYKGEGVVVGILDTGISPENPSFAEEGPVDGYVHEWSGSYYGACDPDSAQYDDDFPCNDKLIGAYGFPAGVGARDGQDHGTHTSSTAAGNVVEIELGPEDNPQELTISGVAPHAHLISYAVCTPSCLGSNILSAINQAIADDVDVINYSIGADVPSQNMWSEASNVAWLNANGAGIRIAHSAGNEGPGDATVGRSSDLPWVTSVGASEHHRAIENTLVDIIADDAPAMDDIVGKGFTGGLESGTPVVYDTSDPHCYNPQSSVVEGAIALCDRGGPSPIGRVQSSENVAAAGAVGFVLMNAAPQADSVHGDEFALPGVHVSHAHGEALKDLVANSDQVTAGVAGYEFNYDNPYTDYQASFSSRGPNGAASTLVPNVTAPGLDIIAAYGAYTEGSAPPVEWGVMSGTSMSSPHIAGVYGLLAQVRPDWSPAATQSALQLTARPDTPKEDGSLGDPHSEGSGYGNVAGAADAGFVMDITEDDFWAADPDEGGDVRQLNLAELVNFEQARSFTWNRELTSTQDGDVTYTVSFDGDDGLDLEAPNTVTIAAGATEEVAFTATTDADAPIGATLFGRVTLTSDADVPDAHLPVVVTIVEPETNLDVDPDAVSAVLEEGGTSEATLTVSNTGNEALTWLLTDEGSGAIWDQPIDGTSGIVSDRFIDNVDDSGVFSADDFTVGGDGATVESIYTPGFWAPTYPGEIDTAYQISWYIYPDEGGAPAGHPDDGQNLEVWSFAAEPDAEGIFINDDDVTLNLAAAGEEALSLAPGDYWISVFPDIDHNPESLNDRWNWYNGTASGESAKLVDPDGLFGAASDEWQDFGSVGIDWDGLAFTLSGALACSLPEDVSWLNVDPVTGDLGAGEADEVAVTFDATGLELGTYTADLCFGTDDPSAPIASVAVELEVTAYGSIDGTVTDGETATPVEGATVTVAGLDLTTTTDADGNYEFPEVAVGERTVTAKAGGYAAEDQVVNVEQGETATADFALGELPPMIGILDDGHAGSQLADFLDDYGLPNMPATWDDDAADYSIVVVNRPGDPGESVFTDFVDDADQAGTGLVLLDTWSAGTGIGLLNTHLDNPAQRGQGWGDGELSYEVTAEHPIVDGYQVGQEIVFDVSSDFDYAWFDEYTGDNVTLIADALAGGDRLGRGIAVDDRGSSRHALLSMHGASPWVGPQYWEGGGVQVFLNALDWVSDEIDIADPELEQVVVEPDESELDVGESVQLTATAVYSNYPNVDVTNQATWASSNEDVATVNGGAVTGIAAGDATITATYEGLSGSATVTVLPEGPLMSVDPEALHVEVTEGDEADTTLTLSNTGDQDLEWEVFAAEAIEASSTVTGEATILPGAAAPEGDTIGDGAMSTQRVGGDEPQRFTHNFAPAQDQVTITHSASQDIVELNSASCGSLFGTSDNSFLRSFTLEDFGIADEFDVTEVQFGVETHAGPAVTGEVVVYQLNPGDDFVFDNLIQRGSAEVVLDESMPGQIVTVPVASDEPVEAGTTLVVEVFVPEVSALGGGFYIGSNPDGQTAPSYLASSDCGMPEPTDTAEFGFGDMHIVMNVTGDAGPAACDVPADIDWLSADPAAGTTAPGASDDVTVTVDASDLAVGEHDAVLCVSSNAANVGLVEVPVSVEVTELELAIGVAGDYNDQIGAWLDAQGIAHEPFALGDDPSEFTAVLVNEPADPGKGVFAEFIAETDAAGVGVVLVDTFSPGNRMMGIELAAEYLGNPGDRDRKQGGDDTHTVAYEVTESHPVVGDAAPGEVIEHDVSTEHSSHAWFADYAGDGVTAVADVLVDGDTLGQGIAVDDRETNRHVLLSLHGTSKFVGPGNWTDDTQQVMVNALEYASR